MRKVHIVLLTVFAAGVLLGGIGTGIAFGEYSSMGYGETVLLGEEDLVTGELIYEFEPVPGEKIALNPNYWGNSDGKSILLEDANLPMGTICYDVTYNSKMTAPHLSYWETDNRESADVVGEQEGDTEEDEGTEKSVIVGYLELRTNYIGGEFELVMKSKDRILSDLKQKKLNSYETVYITDVKIRLNPGMLEYVEDFTAD